MSQSLGEIPARHAFGGESLVDMKLLNVGCGDTFHPQWTNLDYQPHANGVIACDVRQGLTFPAAHFVACYSSHLLEHLSPEEGTALLAEMHRVLAPGGVIRVVVPDLERVARDYLETLERALAEGTAADDDYDWMMIQLLDQSVRRASGGAMAQFWRDPARNNHAFVAARAGLEAERVMARARAGTPAVRRTLWQRVRSRSPRQLTSELRQRTARTLVGAIAGGSSARAFTNGLFRASGEIHQWMYDRYSLARALTRAGFSAPRVVSARESLIPGFVAYELDAVGARVRKPDSLFMEALKATPTAPASERR
jgi:SAM-dependent methyltransferase